MREMRESGVEWMGEIPVSWQILTIGSVFKVRNEKVNDTDYPPLSVTKGGVVPQMENVAKSDANDNRKMVLSNDFVINSRSDRKQSCGVSPMDGSVSLINTVLYPANGAPVIPAYLNYLLKNYGFAEEFYRWGHGIVADLWTTRWQEMKSILLPIPSMGEQQQILEAISEKTDKVDTLIANVQAQIEKLKTYKQSLITEVVTKGLDPNVPMKDSGVNYLGRIPSGWSIISIGQAFTYVGGFAFKSELFTTDETQYQVLRIGNVKNDNLILDNKQIYVDGACAESAKVAEVHIDDILFTMTGTKGKHDYFYTLLVNENHTSDRHLFINQRVGLFRAKSSKIKMAFANYVLKEKRILDYIFLSETGTANQGNIGIENIARTKLYLPSLAEQEQIVSYLDEKCSQIDRLIALKEEKIEKLEQYKHSLIYECVTGKREVV